MMIMQVRDEDVLALDKVEFIGGVRSNLVILEAQLATFPDRKNKKQGSLYD